MKKFWLVCSLMATLVLAGYVGNVRAQDAAAPAAKPAAVAAAAGAVDPALDKTDGSGKPAATDVKKPSEFYQIVFGSGWFGFLIWLGLFGSAAAAVYFSVDSAIAVRPKRIMPQVLVESVTQAMLEGDVLKALKSCESEPGPLSNVLSAGFSHVEEGFEVIQDSVATAADYEVEKIMQKLNWISVCANLAPMLGLLGTVQGMIMAFAGIAKGVPDTAYLALAIAQALYTTAAGLLIAIPCITAYYNFRNSANRTFLKMEAMTMELIKDLRNVEVVES